MMDGRRDRKLEWWMRENVEDNGVTAVRRSDEDGEADTQREKDFIFSLWVLI